MSDMANRDQGQNGTGAEAQGGLDEFDKAVEDFIASNDSTPADAAADNDTDPVETPANIEQPGSAREAGKTDQAAAPAPAETQSTDIWATAPPELRAERDRLEADYQHRLRSTQGRLSTADRELARLRAESQQRTAPELKVDQAGANAPADDDDLAAIREEYGDIVNPLLKRMNDLSSELATLKAPVLEMGNAQEIQARNDQIDYFTKAHPDWQSYVNDKRYADWIVEQPRAVQDAAARAVSIEDGHEAAWLLGQFKQSLGVGSTAHTTEADPHSKPQADPRRARQLNAGRDGGAGSPAVQTGIPDDFDAATDAFIAKNQREASRKSSGQFG